jgi:hypothetical protein
MKLATWGISGSTVLVDATVKERLGIAGELMKTETTYCLVPTEKGREWVARYDKLLHELHAVQSNAETQACGQPRTLRSLGAAR